ncbi:sigma-54-dependent transcriptional regulator [Planctobacterium marinum]|uniref:Sigma-54-dependent Fis family transcriptional regulator n=1 Tax=Planctobacterium marinum TaxID=1631968 RepID=A0AA48KPJ8_9ALTE|nr:sigma-54-dependent Fis family transcriptional regulator [Planctobacterium marinum]
MNNRILIVDDDEDILVASKLLLKRHFDEVVICNRPEQIPQLMAQAQPAFDVILLDMNFGPGESSCEQGFSWLRQILEIDPQAVVILITAHGAINLAVEAMKQGATDFVAKPWQNEKLLATVSAACQLRQTRMEATQLKQTNKALSAAIAGSEAHPMLGRSKALEKVKQIVSKAAATNANMLLLGENGTGKEMLARTIHANSLRADNVFMSIDLGAVPENLFESELFGHKKGAFTDAREDRVGKIQAANGGTLFLDEIGNLPLHLQTRLLTVLEQRKVVPLGSNEPIGVDIRLISATNLSVEKLQDEQYFRQDLLFRLNTVEITLPPLRERKEDIEEIAQHYLALFVRKYQKAGLKLSPESTATLLDYHWPGNVRELKHALERAVILSDTKHLNIQDFQLQKTLPDNHSSTMQEQDLNLERMEKQVIQQALRKHKYNISHAAKALGLTRAALYRRMEKHDL